MHLTRLVPVVVLILSTGCSSVMAHSRRTGPRLPSREPGCDLVMVPSPSARPSVVIGEVTCEAGGDEGDRLTCQEQIRDEVCSLGADGFAARTEPSGRLYAVALKFTADGQGQQGPPGWGPPNQQQQVQQQQMQQQQQVQQQVQPPPGPAQCVPPCPAGSHCSADGRRCEPDAGATPAGLTDQQIQEALDRIRRRVLRCRPRGDENDVTVELEIEPGGSVASVRIDGPLANTDAGGCIEQAVFRATFPAFEGQNRSLRHSFTPQNP